MKAGFRYDIEAMARRLGPRTRGRIEEQRMALSLLTQTRLADVASLAKIEDGTRPALQKLLREQVAGLPMLSDVLGRRYFNLTEKDAKWHRAYSRAEP